MGTYREQLLKETYGSGSPRIYGKPEEETPSGFLTVFKLKFTISLILFAGFVYLSMTGKSFYNVTAEQIRSAVTSGELVQELADWQKNINFFL